MTRNDPPGCWVRWMIRADLRPVLAIDEGSFAEPWSPDDYLAALRNRHTIGVVAESKATGEVVAVMVYRMRKSRLELLRLAVRPDARGRGIGGAMVGRLARKAAAHRSDAVELVADERLTGALRFFQACGFAATGLARGEFGDADGVRMVLDVVPAEARL